VAAAWAFLEPILVGCAERPARELPTYAAGSWGPKEADDLLAADGRRWMLVRRPKHGG
jgi:glucose-6-phosphate 1-dehydrogenase